MIWVILIRPRRGIWCCSLVDLRTRAFQAPLGHGYTPSAAYAEWQAIRQEQG